MSLSAVYIGFLKSNVNLSRRSGFKIPHSRYYIGPPTGSSAFGTEPMGRLGVHHPREIVRIERDYSGGELVQFSSAYPLELDGRVRDIKALPSLSSNDSAFRLHPHNLSKLSIRSTKRSYPHTVCGGRSWTIRLLFCLSIYPGSSCDPTMRR